LHITCPYIFPCFNTGGFRARIVLSRRGRKKERRKKRGLKMLKGFFLELRYVPGPPNIDGFLNEASCMYEYMHTNVGLTCITTHIHTGVIL
jgi:hypothetical protein